MKSKNTIVVIILVLIIVIASISSIFLYNKEHGITNDTKKEVNNEVQEEVQIVEDKTINITVTGDILCHNTNFWDAYDANTDTYDFSYSFEDIKKYFDTSDLAIGTLECNFAGKEVRI